MIFLPPGRSGEMNSWQLGYYDIGTIACKSHHAYVAMSAMSAIARPCCPTYRNITVTATFGWICCTQHKPGNALLDLAPYENSTKHLREASEAYQSALDVLTSDNGSARFRDEVKKGNYTK